MEPKNKKVLIVDDDEDTCSALVWKFKKAGLEPEVSVTGEDALAKVRSTLFPVMLLDLRIPGKDGFAILREMKDNGLFKKTKVIVFTNLGQQSTIQKALELGAIAAYIKADTSIDDITNIVKESLS